MRGRDETGPADGVPLALNSTPNAATVSVDGRARGRTPTTVLVAPGRHEILLGRPDTFDARYQLDVGPDGATVAADLWRRQPEARRLRPTFPGATVVGASFLADGRVVLTVALPPDDERQRRGSSTRPAASSASDRPMPAEGGAVTQTVRASLTSPAGSPQTPAATGSTSSGSPEPTKHAATGAGDRRASASA